MHGCRSLLRLMFNVCLISNDFPFAIPDDEATAVTRDATAILLGLPPPLI